MTHNRAQLRGSLLVEDKRTERFFRELLDRLGFDKHKFRIIPLINGKGDARAWVRGQYISEVKLLRQKRHQRLCLIAVRDGDNIGVASRKADLNSALCDVGLDPRQQDELIATPVPTWSIETWLLALLGDASVDETVSRKQDFQRRYPEKHERQSLRDAAHAWRNRADQIPSVPSLADGRTEMSRIDP
ncbi:MAG: hypothetical protein ACJ74W_13970 [Pyrinomonadaceae bacterium]